METPIWYPCTQMKDCETLPRVSATAARGAYIHLSDGHQLIDAISSWWCKPIGHGHPRIREALISQAGELEHVIFANITQSPIVTLSEKLASMRDTLTKVMYASDGSCSVEMALKMSLHARQILGQHKKKKFASLQNSYHGETCGALSVSDVGIYCDPYKPILFECAHIENVPYVTGRFDPLWENCQKEWEEILKQLTPLQDELTAIIVEPILQGAGGMKIYSADFLKRLRLWCIDNDVHFIADEIMTGFGRTGKWLACDHAEIQPDFLCLGKALTGGWLPMSAMLTTKTIYDLFYDDYEKGKSFLHSHTFSGNALAAACANAFLSVCEDEHVLKQATLLEDKLRTRMMSIADQTGQINNIRCIGGMIAADMKLKYPNERRGFEVMKKAISLGALIRPLGNALYWLPPLNISDSVLDELQRITIKALKVKL